MIRLTAALPMLLLAGTTLLIGTGCSRAVQPDHDETTAAPSRPPNVILILADDMGYGDTGLNGHPSIKTPHLDRMAEEGQNWSQFYVAAAVCTPSRAALLTGRLPVRSGLASAQPRVFFPWSKGGLPDSEFTLAEMFQSHDYATKLVGKWHLGHLPPFLPTQHGFDSWYGIPYSNDMDKTPAAKTLLRDQKDGEPFPTPGWYEPQSEWFEVPLMRGEITLERAPDQSELTERYTEESLEFIRQHRNQPFFLYLAFSMPHVPLFRSADFEGTSEGGLYGDVIQELDASVGRILDELRALHLEDNTLVVFTSDNGPWLRYKTLGGSAGPFRDGKSTAWEGGFRVPAIFWGPGRISPREVQDMGSTLDFMATFAALTGSTLPDVQLDSVDLTPVLIGGGDSLGQRGEMFFYLGDQLAAVRQGNWKAHFWVYDHQTRKPIPLEKPLLYDVQKDPSEQFDLAANEQQALAVLTALRDRHLATIVPVENQLTR